MYSSTHPMTKNFLRKEESKMYKTIFTFFICFLLFCICKAQVQQQWVALYSGGDFDNYANAMTVDNLGNVYVTGVISSDYGATQDICTIKYNSSGTEQWVQVYDGPAHGPDGAWAIAVDRLNNVYITGYSWGGSHYRQNMCTIKYSPDGVLQWVQRYAGLGDEGASADDIGVDNSGNVYVTGSSYNGAAGYVFCTIKYSSSGVQQWLSTYSSPGGATSIVIDSDGNSYITGQIYVNWTKDYCTIKYDPAGVQQWVAIYNGPGNGDDVPGSGIGHKALTVDCSGNVYVTGYSKGIGTANDYATLKYNSAGVQQWAARYDGPLHSSDGATSIALDNSGNVYVTGRSYGSLQNNGDYCTVKYNSSGTQQWVMRFDGPGQGYNQSNSIAVDSYGNVYITGVAMDTVYYWGSCYSVKYSTSGVQQWVALYPGSPSFGNVIKLDESGNVYVTGGWSDPISGSPNFMTIKYSQTLPCQLTVSAGNDTIIYFGYGAQNAILNATPSAGTPPYSYLWSNNSNSQSITVNPTATTSYIVTVTDANNCTARDTVVVNVIDVRCGENNNKVLVCHNELHNPQTICVDSSAVAAHLAHGDRLGNCSQNIVIGNPVNEIPDVFKLYTNYPNPFNPTTKIKFDLPKDCFTRLIIYDVVGREVIRLTDQQMKAGRYEFEWNASNYSSGIYFYRITAGSFVQTRKMVLVK